MLVHFVGVRYARFRMASRINPNGPPLDASDDHFQSVAIKGVKPDN